MSECTQGVCQDGAAILKDGRQLTVEEILSELRQISQLREALECWPPKELMGMVEDSGEAQMLERLLWFSEVRDAALKATEEG